MLCVFCYVGSWLLNVICVWWVGGDGHQLDFWHEVDDGICFSGAIGDFQDTQRPRKMRLRSTVLHTSP